jgi:hypothetical protein
MDLSKLAGRRSTRCLRAVDSREEAAEADFPSPQVVAAAAVGVNGRRRRRGWFLPDQSVSQSCI